MNSTPGATSVNAPASHTAVEVILHCGPGEPAFGGDSSTSLRLHSLTCV